MTANAWLIFLAIVIIVFALAGWLRGVIDSWPERNRHSRRMTDTPIAPLHQPAPLAQRDVRQLAEVNARAVAGLPTWQIRALFDLSDVQLATHADVSRWTLILSAVEKRTREVRRLLETKRQELRLCGEHESDLVPDFLLANRDAGT